MALRQLPDCRIRYTYSDGTPLVNGRVYTYQPGGAVAKTAYKDSAGAQEWGIYIQLDASGRAEVWWQDLYKIIVKDALGNTIDTQDNYGQNADTPVYGNFNQLANASFEIDTDADGYPDDWTVTLYDATSSFTLDTAVNSHGAISAKFVSQGSGGGYAESDNYTPVSEYIDVHTRFDLRSTVANVRNVVEILWYTTAKTLISAVAIYDDSATNPTTLTTKTFTTTPPATSRYARLRLTGCHSSVTTSGSTWFDNVLFADEIVFSNVAGLSDAQLTSLATVPSANTDAIAAMTPAELAYGDLTTGPGTAEASKAVVLDSNKDISGINSVQVAGAAPATPAANTLYKDNMVAMWAYINVSGGTPSILNDFNVASIADNGVGDYTLTLETGIGSTAGFGGSLPSPGVVGGELHVWGGSSTVFLKVYNNAGALADNHCTCIGAGKW